MFVFIAVMSLLLPILLYGVQVVHANGHADSAFHWFRVAIFAYLSIALYGSAVYNYLVPGLIAGTLFASLSIACLPKALKTLKVSQNV